MNLRSQKLPRINAAAFGTTIPERKIEGRAQIMKEYRIFVDDAAALFYEKVAQRANMPPERIMAAALLRLAGEISAEAISARSEK